MKIKNDSKRCLTCFILLLTLLLVPTPQVHANVTEYFPLRLGNWWAYVNEHGDEQVRVVTREGDIIVMTVYVHEVPVTATAYGVYQNRIDLIETRRGEDNAIHWAPPIPFLMPQYEKEQRGYAYHVDDEGKVNISVPVHARYERFDFETVELQEGSVDAQYVRLSLKTPLYDELREMWFAPEIGLVKERVLTSSHTEQTVKEETWELVRFGIFTEGNPSN